MPESAVKLNAFNFLINSILSYFIPLKKRWGIVFSVITLLFCVCNSQLIQTKYHYNFFKKNGYEKDNVGIFIYNNV